MLASLPFANSLCPHPSLLPPVQVSSAVDPLSALRKDCASRAKETFTSLKVGGSKGGVCKHTFASRAFLQLSVPYPYALSSHVI
jgi:hypothetical protein